MNWLQQLPVLQPVAHALLVLAGVAALGLALGSVKVRGISLGIAGALFSGILLGHLGLRMHPDMLAFTRDFGLMLFVYSVGIQVGPGFLTSLRHQGLPLNLMATGIVLLGALLTLGIVWIARLDPVAAIGLFAGATTNTPALGAAQDALKSLPGVGPERVALAALGYAVSYPFGILGIILSMVALRAAFRVDPAREVERFQTPTPARVGPLERMNILVEHERFNGLRLDQIPGLGALHVAVSRIKPQGSSQVVTHQCDTPIFRGDTLLAVGPQAHLEQCCRVLGRESHVDLLSTPGPITRQRVVVTRPRVIGMSLRELGLNQLCNVAVTRMTRADIEMTAIPDLKLQFGDMLQVVGEKEAIVQAAQMVGDSVKELNHTHLIPVFVGLVLGILLGACPITLPHMPAPVRLGLAGGPLIAALVLSRIGRIGPLVWYLPVNASTLLRGLGIVLFLSCVGLKAGEHFFELLLRGQGLAWMGKGYFI